MESSDTTPILKLLNDANMFIRQIDNELRNIIIESVRAYKKVCHIVAAISKRLFEFSDGNFNIHI